MLRGAKLHAVLDELASEEIEPVIAVFVDTKSGYEYARAQRGAHTRMLVEELVPRIDARYRTSSGASNRAVIGVEEAAFAALDIGFQHPQTFGNIGAQSPLAIGDGGRELAGLIAESALLPVEIYLDWGRFDYSNDATETDIPGYSRNLRAQLLELGYSVSGREWNDASDVAVWAARSRDLLKALFPRRE